MAAIACVAITLTLLMPFRGMLPPFYYAEYNSVKNKLDAIPNLTILNSWQHQDMILEDCGFDVAIGGHVVSLTFVDHQDWPALFREVEGIRISTKNSQRLVTRKELRSAGIQIDGLGDILGNLNEVLSFCENEVNPSVISNEEFGKQYNQYLKYIRMDKLNFQKLEDHGR